MQAADALPIDQDLTHTLQLENGAAQARIDSRADGSETVYVLYTNTQVSTASVADIDQVQGDIANALQTTAADADSRSTQMRAYFEQLEQILTAGQAMSGGVRSRESKADEARNIAQRKDSYDELRMLSQELERFQRMDVQQGKGTSDNTDPGQTG